MENVNNISLLNDVWSNSAEIPLRQDHEAPVADSSFGREVTVSQIPPKIKAATTKRPKLEVVHYKLSMNLHNCLSCIYSKAPQPSHNNTESEFKA